MTQLSADVIRAASWRCFTPDTPETEARAVYALREGAQPQLVGCDQWGKVLAGPVAQEEYIEV